jgi:glutamate-5-semialdehyde dehydrogenase
LFSVKIWIILLARLWLFLLRRIYDALKYLVLCLFLSVKVVSGVDDALAHIRRFGSEHTEAIITEDAAAAQQFLDGIASAVGLWNASTQFCDGGEFGFGAEIGIATGRLHARGPVGLEQLCTYRYKIFGTGQIRL